MFTQFHLKWYQRRVLTSLPPKLPMVPKKLLRSFDSPLTSRNSKWSYPCLLASVMAAQIAIIPGNCNGNLLRSPQL